VQVPEDLNRDDVVDAMDLALWQEYAGESDARADVNSDGAVDGQDLAQIEGAIASGKRARVALPELPGRSIVMVTRARNVRLVFYQDAEARQTSYLMSPFTGQSREREPGVATIPWKTGGGLARVTFDERGRVASVERQADGEEWVPILRAEADLVEMETRFEEEEGDCGPLPPIGNCPGCVPAVPPAPGCKYLYSKWGFFCNCLLDFWGCPGSSQVQMTVAGPGSSNPDCDDFGVVPP
jgi:hypothetical protein